MEKSPPRAGTRVYTVNTNLTRIHNLFAPYRRQFALWLLDLPKLQKVCSVPCSIESPFPPRSLTFGMPKRTQEPFPISYYTSIHHPHTAKNPHAATLVSHLFITPFWAIVATAITLLSSTYPISHISTLPSSSSLPLKNSLLLSLSLH